MLHRETAVIFYRTSAVEYLFGDRRHFVAQKKRLSHMRADSLIVLSGGLDSAVMSYKLASEGKKLRAFFGDFGKQVSQREKESAKLISLLLDMPLDIGDVKGLTDLDLGYLPWDKVQQDEKDMETPKRRDLVTTPVGSALAAKLAAIPAGRPDWFSITGIHTLLSIATNLAQITDIREISIGFTKEQMVANPSLRDALDSWEKTIELFNPKSGKLTVHTPFAHMTKNEIVSLGASLNVPFRATWSCYFLGDFHCGTCGRCKERKGAFAASGVCDPTEYLDKQ